MNEYLTIQEPVCSEIEEKKSKFIAQLAPVTSEEEALSFLADVREKHRMARHNVYAYLVHNQNGAERIRYSDDGEPAKTAGLPVLQALQHANITNAIIVVTRYFGGTLLGTGGLVRAYTQAAQEAIRNATIIRMVPCVDIRLTTPYEQYDQVMRLTKQNQGTVIDTQYTDEVALMCRFADGTQQKFLDALNELFKGNAPANVSAPALHGIR